MQLCPVTSGLRALFMGPCHRGAERCQCSGRSSKLPWLLIHTCTQRPLRCSGTRCRGLSVGQCFPVSLSQGAWGVLVLSLEWAPLADDGPHPHAMPAAGCLLGGHAGQVSWLRTRLIEEVVWVTLERTPGRSALLCSPS